MFLMIMFCLFVSNVNAQIAVTVTNNTNTTPNLAASYTSLATALTDLNSVTTMTGPVTLVLAAGNETTPSTGLQLGSASLNAVLNATNNVTLIGAGSATILNAGVGTATPASAVPDGILKLVGVDYVTINGITFTDGNTTNPATMEVGLGMFKLSATDGCQNNTIQNCIFNMQRVNNANSTAPMVEGSVGVAMMNSTALASTTVLTVTAASGSNSNNKFYNNTINSGNYGIVLIGFAAVTPFTLADTNNEIGALGFGNSILNFGGGAATNPSAGIRTLAQYGLNVNYNIVNNNNGTGVNHLTTLRGIYINTAVSASANITNNNITVISGATTSLLEGINNASGSTAASNTININNNIVALGYPTQTSATINGILNGSSAATVNINNNTVTQAAGFALAGTGTWVMIEGGSPGGILNTNNNIVSNIVRTGASGSMRCVKAATPVGLWTSIGNLVENISYSTVASTGGIDGIYDLSSATLMNISNNIVRNLSTPTTGTINGININTVSGTHTCSNNQVYNFTTTSGGAGGATFTGIVFSVGNATIFGNQIYDLNSTGTSGGTVGAITGIRQSAGTTNSIYNNKIYNLSSTSTGAIIYGINASGGTTNTIYNNIIGDLRATAANVANAIRGIDIASTNANVYYNTINLNATSSGAVFGTSALNVSSTTNLDLRNNIFNNTSTANSTGLAAAYRRSSTTLTSYAAASNNNLFYGSTIFTDGTNTDATLVAFKARVTPRDTASITENPTFVSTTGSNINFLHIDTAVATQIESGGTTVSGITNDFDGNIRNVTTPDIGADEFTGVLADFTAPTISHTAPTASCIQGDRVVSATITDASGVSAGIGLPVAYWRINAGAYIATTGVDMGAGVYNFTIGSGSVYGDIITYYFVAQDNAAAPNVAALPLAGAAGFSTNPPAVSTAPTTPFSTTLLSALSGTYTVGAAGNYTTLTAAVNDFNIRCLSGPVVFDLLDTTYPSETFPITILQNADTNATNTLTIKPATGVTTTISGSNAAAIIKLNGADYVTIDGSNNGSSSKDLTINNTNTGTTSAVLWNGSANASNGALNNTFKNLNIFGNASLTTFVGVFNGSGTTMGSAAESANNNFIVNNNSVAKSQYGVAVAGAASGNTGNVISNNVIGSNTVTDYIGFIGLFASNSNGIQIKNNTIFNIITTANNPIGINIAANVINSTIDSNIISGVAYTGTTGYGGKGVNVNTANAASNLTISNNMISNIRGDGWSSLASADIVVGLRITGTTGGVNVYHNTINLGSGTFVGNASGTFSAAFHIASTVTSLNVRNNIFGTNLVNSAAAGAKTYAIACEAPNTIFTNIDYNNYFVTGTQGVLGFLTSDRANLAAIQAGFGQNVASLNVSPVFVSATDLHLVTTTNTAIDNKGTAIAAVTLDIDGNVRSATTPDMGADEFTSTACTSAIGGTASALVSTFCDSGSTTISSTGYSTGFSTTYQWQSSVDLAFTTPINEGAALTVYADLVTPTITSTRYYRLAVTCVENGQANFSNVVTVTINVSPNADAPANVTACDSYTLPALTVGNYFTGAGGTGTALSAGNTISSSQTIYVYAQTGTTPNCTDENSFSVTINTSPIADAPANVTACDSYTLPALTVGNYFTGAGGTGTALSAGNSITSSQTIYVFAQTGTTPNCTDENSFTVTITAATISGVTTQVINGGVAADATIEDIVVTSNGTVTWFASSADATANINPLPAGTQLVSGNIYYGVTNIGICRSTTLAVTVTVVLGNTSFDLSQLNYYPNPVKDIFNVKYNKEITSIEVYDLTGRNVISIKPNTLEVQLNMTNLSSAMYIVRLQSVDGFTDLKIYKN